ncbi:MAG TPA: chromosome segregation protein SMC [Ignavibacteriaceae bacterium]|nr:chromosome segregation protein SMC [Ignavibacteriaceae bacterium]
MYLSKLEILGFKSFAQRTDVKFNQGVTSIVGPNGCGKTNIVDAIRWCLGEQRSSALRSDKMENVIFNGTAGKKPMGMAEVSLTIQNTRGILPTEYSEVTITRRIFRSGESEYLLNKNLCRLKDITNLFMDTGIGANAYSVIELKMVETILSNKAEERRTMFEEAAGVNKYKLRRRLALRKLDEVRSDLTRVNDIVSEVEKKVNSLERQAKKADRYNRISTQLRELELDLAEREMSLFNRQKDELKNRKEENFSKKLNLESEISKLEDELAIIKQSLLETESELKYKRKEVTEQTAKVYNIQKQISVAEEREKSLESNISRYQLELEELNIQLDETKRAIEDNSELVREISDRIYDKQKFLEETKGKANNFKTELENKRSYLKGQSEKLIEQFKEITNKENDLANIQNSLNTKNESIEKLNEKIQALTNNIAKTVGYLEELGREKTQTADKLSETESLYAQKQKEKDDLEKELNTLKVKELEDRSVINSIKDKIGFIQTMIDNLEGVSKGAKTLVENPEWSKGEKTLLAHIGSSSDEYRLAIEASLRNNLNNILVRTIDDLKSGIEYLKSNKAGRATFFAPSLVEGITTGFIDKLKNISINRNGKKLSKETGFIAWSKDLVESDKKWESYFKLILNESAVVSNLETAFLLSSKYHDFNFVTLQGDYVDNHGIVESGSEPQLDDSLFGRMQLLDSLRSEFPKREKDLITLKSKIVSIEKKIEEIDLKILSEEERMLLNDLSNVDKQIAQFEYEKNKANDEIEKARLEIKDLVSISNKIDNERNDSEEILNKLKKDKTVADDRQKQLEEEFHSFEQKYNAELANQNSTNLELERLLGDKRNAENAILRAEKATESIEKSILKREQDIKSSVEESSAVEKIIEDNRLKYDDNLQTKEMLVNQEKDIDLKYESIQNEISDKENVQKKLRKEREILSEEIHESDIKLSELKMKLSNLVEHIKENYSVTLENKVFDDLNTFDFRTRTDEVQALKQKVKNLGPINLLAYSEYEEERERFEFLNKQRNDLLESEKDVVNTITEINTTAQTQFKETFDKIRENFINIFRGLFNPGDEADLRIEEDADPLEAKIEIIAKPKGKRPTSIDLLSGGEKTLTAIALLFAIYLVKPSPFCILDEIDAPLDDANIDRFTKIIEDFSKETQFIVVTHNKRTMEAAETLYGVTMQDEGISKLVSVRFNEDFDFVNK